MPLFLQASRSMLSVPVASWAISCRFGVTAGSRRVAVMGRVVFTIIVASFTREGRSSREVEWCTICVAV